MVQFGDILAELRQDHKMTQKELAKALGIATSSISAYERGTRLPAFDILVEFANFFDVTVDYLTGRTKRNISLALLSEPFTENISLGELIQSLAVLSPVQRQAISTIIKDMRLIAEIKRNRQDGET